MKQCKFIKIEDAIVTGVLQPVFVIKGSSTTDTYEFLVKVDDVETEYNNLTLSDRKQYAIIVNLLKYSKKIEVYCRENEKQNWFLLYKTKTFLIKRVQTRLFEVIKTGFRKIGRCFYVLGRGIRFLWKEYHFLVPIHLWGKYFHDFKESISRGSNKFYNPNNFSDYQHWLKLHDKDKNEKMELKYQPLISILTPVYNVDASLLMECVNSVLNQSYTHFELCLVDDCSNKEDTKEALQQCEALDARIKVHYREKNGHISRASNDALKMANGEFIALLDNDDVLDSDALYEMVKVLNQDKKIDFIYSDEDKLDLNGKRCEPHFKPDFSPDTLLSLNYICHFSMIRKRIVDEVGGFEVGLEGAQDYDLFLKIVEKTKKIAHVPKILYHWRKTKTSTALSSKNKDYAADKGKIAIENALKRRKIKATVEKEEKSGYYRVHYEIKKEPLISIIIPTRDYVDVLKTCVDSILKKTTYKNYEIIVVNNDSKEKKTQEFFANYTKKYKNFHIVDCIMPFNYSKINNIAVSKAKGEYIVLLNNDTEVISADWLTTMVGYAMQKHIGVVGTKLLYSDETIQHAGVILGLGGVASHAYIGSSKHDTGMFGRLAVPYNYSACTAACIMIQKKKYEEVNGLNEKLEVAYNDIDFCLRIRKENYYNVFLPQVSLIHYESKSRGLDTTTEKYKRFLKESDYMYKHWQQELQNDPFYNSNFSKKGWFMLDK